MRAVVVVLLVPSVALAGGNQDADVATLVDARDHDAAAGRGFLMGTAITAPAGSVTLGVRQPTLPLGAISIGLGVTDRVELGVGVGYLPGDGSDLDAYPAVSLEVQALRTDRAAVAVEVGAWRGDRGPVIAASLLASACLGARSCYVVASGHVTGVSTPPREYTPRETTIVGGGALLIGTGGSRFLFELDAWGEGPEHPPTVTMAIGARFPSEHASFDLGAGLISTHDGGGSFVIPGLLLGLSLRR